MQRRLNDQVTVSGQIFPEDIARLQDEGFKVIVAARADGEMAGQPNAADIQRAAEEAGLTFAHIPVQHGVPPSAEDAARFAELKSHGPVFAYCGAGPRAIFLASLAASSEGQSIDAIIDEAAQAGVDLSPALPLLQSFTAQTRSS